MRLYRPSASKQILDYSTDRGAACSSSVTALFLAIITSKPPKISSSCSNIKEVDKYCNNLYPVTKAIKSKFLNITIGVAADDNGAKHKDENTSIDAAVNCYKAGAAWHIKPPFDEGILKIDVQTGTIIAVLTTATQHRQCFWPVIQPKRPML